MLGPGSVDIVKGWTRSTAVATILIGASEVDVSDPAGLELLKPLFPVLDKVWLVPVHADWPPLSRIVFLRYKISDFAS